LMSAFRGILPRCLQRAKRPQKLRPPSSRRWKHPPRPRRRRGRPIARRPSRYSASSVGRLPARVRVTSRKRVKHQARRLRPLPGRSHPGMRTPSTSRALSHFQRRARLRRSQETGRAHRPEMDRMHKLAGCVCDAIRLGCELDKRQG